MGSTQVPTDLDAVHLEGQMNSWMVGTGRATVSQPNVSITADEIRYLVPDERCIATGDVFITRFDDTAAGPKGEYNLQSHTGYLESPFVQMAPGPERPKPGHANGSLAKFLDEVTSHIDDAFYSTCPVGDEAWYLVSSDMDLHQDSQIGEASNARIVFEGVPIVYSPFLTFPLNDKRKSGFLAPDFGSSNTNGFDTTVPYYFNLAPNMDDTLTPRLLSKRGVLFADEFRYLDHTERDLLTAEYLNNDRLTGSNRYTFSLLHQQNLPQGFVLNINAQEASDGNYFRDLGSTSVNNNNAAINPYLPRDISLTKQWDLWSFSLRSLSYQTMQDPNNPIVDQYRMRPQFIANYSRDLWGTDFDFNNEVTDFRHPSEQSGTRIVSYPQLRIPLSTDYGFIAPKVGVHYTDYQLDAYAGTPNQTLTRTLPIASLDSGLFFDRRINFWDRDMTQTLEPRLYYVYIPYRDQSQLPVFNSGVADFSYSQLFSENQFSGPDRINDANQLSVALQSRLIQDSTGAELVRGLIGQRYYFRDQQVLIPGQQVRTGNTSDWISGLSARFSKEFSSSFAWDYNPELNRTEKFNFDNRYVPTSGQAYNFAYRINRDTPGQADIRQIDVSSEWPLTHGWTAVARLNYDTAQSTVVESLFGAEYTSGCWALRIVTDRLTVSSTQVNSVLFVQLELSGMVHLGKNPLEALKSNIPGYQKTSEILQ